jgi:hypothetical protein
MEKNQPPQPQLPQQQQQPQQVQQPGQPGHPPNVVYVTRPIVPHAPVMTDEIRQKSIDSKNKYPQLHLSEGEYVIFAIHRHFIGLIEIWAVVILLAVLILFGVAYYAANPGMFSSITMTSAEQLPSAAVLTIPALFVIGLFVLGGWIATYVYQGNKLFLTNESVIQVIRNSLFSTQEQTISLGNVEDASFIQHGLLQYALNYGLIRLSTEGEETTYSFNYAPSPRNEIAKLNEAVEAFKMGRPVDPDES